MRPLLSLFVIIITFTPACLYADTCTITPENLKCQNQSDQIYTDSPAPLLSWTVTSKLRNQSQSAYQIMVADNLKSIKNNTPNLWDSGKINSNRTINIPYQGRPLKSSQRCYWKLRIWDKQNRPSKWSAPHKWQTTLLKENDFHAQWINAGKKVLPPADPNAYNIDPAPLFRKNFNLNKPIKNASLHITGLGYYLSYINGKKISDHHLSPAWTVYSEHIQYDTFDVTAMLNPGKNTLAAILGNGWYNPLPLRMWGWLNIQTHLTTDRPALFAQLAIEFTDGTKQTIITDQSWKTADSPILKNNIYLGELYDATKEIQNWNCPDFDDTNWKTASLAPAPAGELTSAKLPPIRITKKIKPVKMICPKKDVTIYDFGQNFAGWVKLKINAPANTKIKLRYAELLGKDNTLNPMTSACGQIKGKKTDGSHVGGTGSPEIAYQQDTYIAKGCPGESFCPTFTFHAFRYVEVSGNTKPLKLDDITGLRLNTDVAQAGTFSCSNDLFNKIQQNTQWTFLSNIFSVQSDCPHRERFGYGGDIAVTTDAFIMNYDMSRFYANTVNLFKDSAAKTGRLTSIAPHVGIDCGLVWQMAHPLLLSELYQYYGNKQIVEQNYPLAKKWLDQITKKYPDHIITAGLSDHESLEKTPSPQLVTPLYYKSTKLLARLAEIINKTEDAQYYNSLAEKIRIAYLKNFNKNKDGRFEPNTQTSQSFALYLNLVPQDQKLSAVNALIENIRSNDSHLTTGIFGTKFMLDVLSRSGHGDIAYEIVNQKTFPGWGHMIDSGATTLWEHWQFSDNTFSHNHPMFGSVSQWFYNWLAGIQPAADACGFDKIIIAPQIISDLKWVKATYNSIRGPIASNWSLNDNTLTMQITIPANTTAIVYIPTINPKEIKESQCPIGKIKEIKLVEYKDGVAQIKLGSGNYKFITKINP